MSHKAVVHNENLADQEDGAEEEPRPLSCTANCVVSSLLVAYICSRKCDVQKVASEFAFFPPSPPTYQLRRDEASGEVVGIDYNYSELAEELTSASLGNFKAHGIACETLEVGVRQTDRPAGFPCTLSTTTHQSPPPTPPPRPSPLLGSSGRDAASFTCARRRRRRTNTLEPPLLQSPLQRLGWS